MKENKNTYWKDLKEATQTTVNGLGLTWEHFQKSIQSLAQTDTKNAVSAQNQSFDTNSTSNLGIVTNLYPHEMMPIPDNGRYKLHNEIEDCIVCNKCVEACPVNCIEIDAIRGTEQVGTASDGSPIRFYAAKFDIDMAKCCFCGLCTVVCPTECLTMTKEFDFSETDISKMNYEFGNLNKEEAIQKQKEWDDFQAQKEVEKEIKKAKTTVSKLILKPTQNQESNQESNQEEIINQLKPTQKSIIKIKPITSKTEIEKPKLQPIKIKLPSPKAQSTENQQTEKIVKKEDSTLDNSNTESPKQEVKKIIKIKISKPTTTSQVRENDNSNTQKADKLVKPSSEIKIPQPKIEDKNDTKTD